MATYKKQLRDKDGNTIYPDVGLDLDSVVYSDDPSEEVPAPTAWIGPTDLNWTAFKYQYTGTTDANGFLYIPNTVVKPLTGAILAVRCINKNCFTSVYSDMSSDRYTIRCDQYNWSPMSNSANTTVDIFYFLYDAS